METTKASGQAIEGHVTTHTSVVLDSTFIYRDTSPEVILIKPKIYFDQRGYFVETYQRKFFSEIGISEQFLQDSQSSSCKGTLRGMHYQIRQLQGKLVRVVDGEIFDVAVDIRKSSPSFGKWVGVQLSAINKWQLWVPPGFAHGFYVISGSAEILYKLTDYYSPEWSRTLAWNDPTVGIEWPFLTGQEIILSKNNKQGELLGDAALYE